MSVGEWLDTLITDKAIEEGVAPEPRAHAEDDWRSEDDLRPRRKYSDYDERHRRVPDEEFAEINARLDTLTRQLDHLARTATARRDEPRDERASHYIADAIARLDRRVDQLISESRASGGAYGRTSTPDRAVAPASHAPATPLDQALAEIAERQRVLDGEAAAPRAELPRAPTQGMPALEQQLRHITDRIETLRPCGVDNALETLRDDLAEIGVMIKEALPRRTVEALEAEVRSLGDRIHDNRHTGLDSASIAGIERGLAEVRDALRGLTPSENLTGFDETVRSLSAKIDRMASGGHDPAALEQLEGAIVGLRGIVSHVASNDALAKLSEEVRALGAKVEYVAGSDAFSMLERRIGVIADALQSQNQSGQDARGLEAVIAGLNDKLDRLQLTRTDQAAVGHLEDRIVKLVEKLDASDARLNHLEAIERGLAELLIHLEHQRIPQIAQAAEPPEVDTLKRDVERTQDSLEAMHGTRGHVVDRLAMIETDVRADLPPAADFPAAPPSPPAPARQAQPSAPAIPVAAPAPAAAANPSPIPEAERRPIDPDLPPDHPLEPGAVRGRTGTSPAERIAASEAALGSAKPPVIPDPGGKANFIAAARRAAQAASAEAPAGKDKTTAEPAGKPANAMGRIGNRVRTVLVAASVVVIVLGTLHVAMSLFTSHDDAPAAPNQAPAGTEAAPPAPATERQSGLTPAGTDQPAPALAGSSSQPAPAPAPAPMGPAAMPATPIPPPLGTAPSGFVFPAIPARPPVPPAAPDRGATGSVAVPATPAPPAPSERPGGNPADRLPASIGSGGLRAAAVKGDAAAEFEIATRFAEGRGVPQNLAEAAIWFERAANQGLVPAQFRLGGLYEKGVGVKKNLETARRLYTAAAEAGNAKAMHNLAVLHAEGIDGKPDYQIAAKWFRRAAGYGVIDSQYNLGILYARGIGVETNLAEAYKWFILAARDGDKEAARKRDDVGARLDPQSRNAATVAAQAFIAEAQPDAAAQVKTPAGGWDAAPAPAAPKRRVGPKAELSPRPAQ